MPLHREVPQRLLTARPPDAIPSLVFSTNPYPSPTNHFVLNDFRTLSPMQRSLLHTQYFQLLGHQSLPHSFRKTTGGGVSRWAFLDFRLSRFEFEASSTCR